LIYMALLRRYNFEKSGDWEMAMNPDVVIPREAIAAFCKANGIRRLSLFGSALTDHFEPESDMDVLVEFKPAHTPGLLGMSRLERELSVIFQGRKVDLRTAEYLSRYFHQQFISEAELCYAAG